MLELASADPLDGDSQSRRCFNPTGIRDRDLSRHGAPRPCRRMDADRRPPEVPVGDRGVPPNEACLKLFGCPRAIACEFYKGAAGTPDHAAVLRRNVKARRLQGSTAYAPAVIYNTAPQRLPPSYRLTCL